MADQNEIDKEKKRETGAPGGGAGRKDEGLAKSGVYPMSGPHPPGDAPIVTPAAWGQGTRGAAGYEDHGESEIHIRVVKPEKCRDLMTKDPVCCLPNDDLATVAQIMRQYNIGAVPVVQNIGEKVLLGIITDRDIATRAVAPQNDTRSMTADQIMTREVVTCSPDDDCERALQLMEAHRIRRIPAIDQYGRVVGIISQSDVALRLHDSGKTGELVGEISHPGRL